MSPAQGQIETWEILSTIIEVARAITFSFKYDRFAQTYDFSSKSEWNALTP